MSEHRAEDVARLRDEVEKTAQRFEDAVAHIEPGTASDSTRSVSVMLDKDGVVQDVKVDSQWRKSLDVARRDTYCKCVERRRRRPGQQAG